MWLPILEGFIFGKRAYSFKSENSIEVCTMGGVVNGLESLLSGLWMGELISSIRFIERCHPRILQLELRMRCQLVFGRSVVADSVEVAWNTHTHWPKSIEDIAFCAYILWRIGNGLQHWIGKGGKNIVNL